MKKRRIAFVLGLVVMLTACGGKDRAIKENNLEKKNKSQINRMGNSSINIINEGEIAYQDGWYYYNNGKGIYKARENGKGRKKIINEEGLYINVVGDWIYYENKKEGGMRKIKTDGTEYTFLSSKGENLLVDSEWIYYRVRNSGLYKMKTDGTEEEQLVKGGSDGITDINLDDKWVYYFWRKTGATGIYRVKKDGTGNMAIYTADALEGKVGGLSPIILIDNWIYFYKDFVDKTVQSGMDRVKKDGSKFECLYPLKEEDGRIYSFAVFNNELFWKTLIVEEGEDNNTNKDLDGGEDLNSDESEDWGSDDMVSYDKLYKASLKGENKTEIGEDKSMYSYYLNGSYIRREEDDGNITFELYNDQDKKICTLE